MSTKPRQRSLFKRFVKRTFITVGAVSLISFFTLSLIKYQTTIAPSSSVKAIDTAATITDPAWYKQAYQSGIRLYIMHSTSWGTCTPWHQTQPQLKMALEAGLKVATYTRDPRCWEQGILAAGPYKDRLQFFALDVETDPGIPVTRSMIDGVKRLGIRPVIYSGSGMWTDVQKQSTETFDDVPLWDTDTSKAVDSMDNTWIADYRQPTPIVYGGWNTQATMRIGVQQQFEYTFNGIAVDLNSFDVQFLR